MKFHILHHANAGIAFIEMSSSTGTTFVHYTTCHRARNLVPSMGRFPHSTPPFPLSRTVSQWSQVVYLPLPSGLFGVRLGELSSLSLLLSSSSSLLWLEASLEGRIMARILSRQLRFRTLLSVPCPLRMLPRLRLNR